MTGTATLLCHNRAIVDDLPLLFSETKTYKNHVNTSLIIDIADIRELYPSKQSSNYETGRLFQTTYIINTLLLRSSV